MNDTTYQIFQEGRTYKVRITRLGSFVQEADGFASHEDAASWVEQDRQLACLPSCKHLRNLDTPLVGSR
jgi:hypothetical protein